MACTIDIILIVIIIIIIIIIISISCWYCSLILVVEYDNPTQPNFAQIQWLRR